MRLHRRAEQNDSCPATAETGSPPGAAIVRRVFIVGCPRSGTTLLQAMLAAHPAVRSFPESHFFAVAVADGGIRRRLGLATRQAVPALRRYAEELGASLPYLRETPKLLTMARAVRCFVDLLDRCAAREHKSVWVEKTPRHLAHTGIMERHVPALRIVHLIRNPVETVASLVEVTRRFPEVWGGARTVEACTARWLKDVGVSLALLGRTGHTVLRYEQLVADPRGRLHNLCPELGLSFADCMVDGFGSSAGAIVRSNEVWKRGVTAGRITTGRDVSERLTPEERSAVRDRTGELAATLDRVLPLD